MENDNQNRNEASEDKYADLWNVGGEEQSSENVSSSESTYFRYDSVEPERTDEEANVVGTAPSSAMDEPHFLPVDVKTSEPIHRRQSSWKSMFAAFLAGALVVGSLMFTSDRMNLFTGGNDANGSNIVNSVNTAAAVSGNNSSTGVSNTALDVVRPNNISQIASQASPSVVKVETLVKASNQYRGNSLFDDPFFRNFFGDDFYGGNPRSKDNNSNKLVPGGMGSGFIFDKAGYILTNEHVIDGADEITVTVEGHKEPYKAKKLGSDYDLDLAVLKIEGNNDFPALKLGDANALSVGDWLVAIGNPYGFDHTVTVGVLSAKERPISIPDGNKTRNYEHLLQTDASINPGNSGGPLLNMNGEVIGINTAVSAQAQGIGFAIPTSTISKVVDALKDNKQVPKDPAPFIGVMLSDIDQSWVEQLNLTNTDGTVVTQIVTDGPAYRAGLRAGDVITKLDGNKVKNSEGLSKAIKTKKVGDKVTLGVVRDGKSYEVVVIVGDSNNQGK